MYPYADVAGGFVGGLFMAGVVVVILWQKGVVSFHRPPKS